MGDRESERYKFSLEMTSKMKTLPVSPKETLVKYGNPDLVAVKTRKGRVVEQHKVMQREVFSFGPQYEKFGKDHCVDVVVDGDLRYNREDLQHLLENLYPPLEWREGDRVYLKHVSMEKGKPHDVLHLANVLEEVVDAPVSELFFIVQQKQHLIVEAFDEIIRQILLEKPLKGMLLRQVRDSTLHLLDQRRQIYTSNVAFSTRKQLRMSKDIEVMEQKLQKNVDTKARLQQQIENLLGEHHAANEKFHLIMEAENREFQAEMQVMLAEKRKLLLKLKHMTNTD